MSLQDVPSDLPLNMDQPGDIHTDQPDQTPVNLTGFHQLTVSHAGQNDEFWIYVSQPAKWKPAHGAIVYAHGQGADNYLPCWNTAEAPQHADVDEGIRVAKQFAQNGHLGISVFYRISGPSASLPGLKLRTDRVRDGATLLTALQWVQQRTQSTTLPSAVLGVSMGTVAAINTATTTDALRSLRQGIDLRLVMLAGYTLNHVANASRALEPLITNQTINKQGTALATMGFLAAVQIHAQNNGIIDKETWTKAANRPLIESMLTPAGEALVRELYSTPPNQLGITECTEDKKPASCTNTCAQQVLLRRWQQDAPTDFANQKLEATVWFKEDAIKAWLHWYQFKTHPTPQDRRNNPVLDHLAQQSPLYQDLNFAVPKIAVLIADEDHVTQYHGTTSVDALLNKLRDANVLLEPVPTLTRDTQGPCDHYNYVNHTRPQCGWRDILKLSADAFSP